MNNKIKNLLVRASAYLWGLFLYWVLLKPKSDRQIEIPQWVITLQPDKWVHAAFWFIWVYIFEWSVKSVKRFTPIIQRKSFYVIALISIPLTEFLQYFMDLGRTADVWDALADIIGFTMAVVLFRNKKSGR